jgi:hypothetical protein
VHCSHRMVVILSLKYLNFPADDGILLFFVHFGFLVLLILNGCLGRAEWVYLSASSILRLVICVIHVDFFIFTLRAYVLTESEVVYFPILPCVLLWECFCNYFLVHPNRVCTSQLAGLIFRIFTKCVSHRNFLKDVSNQMAKFL